MFATLNGIQALRAVAVVFVLFSHLFRVEGKYAAETILPNATLIGVSGVDIFFVISGFIMVYVTDGKRDGLLRAIEFLYRRAVRIYPIYWVYTSLVLVLYMVAPSMVNSGAPADILASYALWPTENPFLVAVGWTLAHEMYFYFIFCLLFFVSDRYLSLFLAAWAVMVFLVGGLYDGDSPVLKVVLSPLTIEFIGGAMLGQLILLRKPLMPMWVAILGLAASLSVLIFAGGWYLEATGITPSGWWRVLVSGVPAVFIVFFMCSAELAGLKIPNLLTVVGDSSYSIYLSHVLVMSAMGHVWFKIHGYMDLSSVVVLPVMVVACIVYGYLSYRFIEKPIISSSKIVGFSKLART